MDHLEYNGDCDHVAKEIQYEYHSDDADDASYQRGFLTQGCKWSIGGTECRRYPPLCFVQPDNVVPTRVNRI